jgi:hypothetical protein
LFANLAGTALIYSIVGGSSLFKDSNADDDDYFDDNDDDIFGIDISFDDVNSNETDGIGDDSYDPYASVASLSSALVFIVMFISTAVFFFCPGHCWRLACCGRNKQSIASFFVDGPRDIGVQETEDEDEGPPTKEQIARTRYYLIRLYFLNIGGFLLNAINGSWLAALFLIDEIWALGRVCLHYYLAKKEAAVSNPTPGDEPSSDVEAGSTTMSPTDKGGVTADSSKSTSRGLTNNSTGDEPLDKKA